MKKYGRRSKVCECIYCGEDHKTSTNKGAERNKNKKEIREYKTVVKPSKPSFSKKFIDKMMKK